MFVASAVMLKMPATKRHNTTGFSSNLILHTLHALEVKVCCPLKLDNSGLRFEVCGNKLKAIKKLNLSLWQAMKLQAIKKVTALVFFNRGARIRRVVNATLRRLYPLERDPVTTVQKLGTPSWAVWTGAASVTSTGVGTPDRIYTE
jgi:hypothetical protein